MSGSHTPAKQPLACVPEFLAGWTEAMQQDRTSSGRTWEANGSRPPRNPGQALPVSKSRSLYCESGAVEEALLPSLGCQDSE